MIKEERTTITSGASFENGGTRAYLQALAAMVSPSSRSQECGVHAARLSQEQTGGVRII